MQMNKQQARSTGEILLSHREVPFDPAGQLRELGGAS